MKKPYPVQNCPIHSHLECVCGEVNPLGNVCLLAEQSGVDGHPCSADTDKDSTGHLHLP